MYRKLSPVAGADAAGKKTYRPDTPLVLRTASGGRSPHLPPAGRRRGPEQRRENGPQLELALE